MLCEKPERRPSIAWIKDHPFYKGSVPTKDEIIRDGKYRRSIIAKIKFLEKT
jgi:hypothetical protein